MVLLSLLLKVKWQRVIEVGNLFFSTRVRQLTDKIYVYHD